MKNSLKIFGFVAIGLHALSCRKDKTELFVPVTPPGFPEMQYPQDNAFTYERWLLGKQLFYDNRLSRGNDISCASCHKQHLAFADDVKFTPGDNGAPGKTNAPTLTNVGYQPYFMFVGGVPTLEMQVLVPIQEHNEFNTSILDIVAKLKLDKNYVALAKKAYDRELDAFVITRALANFERTLVSGNSRFDQHFYQGKTTLNASELKGYDLFFSSRTQCSSCHAGFNFTNYAFENNGLYETYTDIGRMLITFNESDRAKFKVPTLRNIALTAPYMHDGSKNTLMEVIEHYNSGGANHPNKNPNIQPLGLTASEKQDLLNFLLTLTDSDFVSNSTFAKQ